jgi:hypothetical protein
MRRCARKVSKTRVRDPRAVCAAQWMRMSPAMKRAWLSLVQHKARQSNPIAVGSRVTLDLRPARPGVYTVSKVLPGGRLHVRNAHGLVLNVPRSAVRSAGNPWPVELHSVAYKEQKAGDKRPEIWEHVFEGEKPRLAYDGKNLRIVRAGSQYYVRNGWIHR